MKRSILLAGIAVALSLSPVSYAQTSPTSPANPKSDLENAQCAQPQPGETHTNKANCPKPATVQTPTKTLPSTKTTKKTATPVNATQTPPPVLPETNPAQACSKPSSSSATASTPSTPGCDSNSGIHEGGPFGH